MAVYKEPGKNTWRVLYRTTDWKGEEKQSTKSGFKTKREALAWEREMLNKATGDLDMIAIDTIAMENEIADNMYERSELDWLIYNVPLEYADLILNGDPEKYLKAVTVYRPFEN